MNPQVVNPADSITRASTLIELNRTAEAERELRGLLAVRPEHSTAHAMLALALVWQGQGAEAVTESQEAIRLAPDQPYPHYIAGVVHHRLGHGDQAVAAAEAALALDPADARTWKLLANGQLLRGRYHDVAEAARRGLALNPEMSDLVSLLAQAHVRLGEAEPAKAAAAHAVRLNPESAMAHLVLGRAELAFGDPRRAAECFRETLRLDPGFDPARDLLVTALKWRNPLYRMLTRLQGSSFGGWRMVFLLPLIPPLIAVFVLIAVLHWVGWVGEAVTVLRLALGRATRLLFAGAEARTALVCCLLVVAGAGVLALGIGLGRDTVGTAGVAVMALVTAVQEAAHTGSARGRAVLYGWTALLGVAIVASVVLASMGTAMLSLYAGLGTIWVAAGVRRLLR
ncbi:tetratricopeptide repeat protein [Nonomuraea jiangxiensis]|uniref:Tetratricopeptide (TPR) repeat n=1 Tax=Nonomuraea jiangxiensis TaxID=633440 RepID=A0A1G8T0A3_9ACTN|nr:tetratricopeptide repeat protein [Nonomuraea jiangxiensis]SDJ34917.1 Tetratricopeptide (TPR) repeat [Nonomuraea jiangxiensis]